MEVVIHCVLFLGGVYLAKVRNAAIVLGGLLSSPWREVWQRDAYQKSKAKEYEESIADDFHPPDYVPFHVSTRDHLFCRQSLRGKRLYFRAPGNS